jgi:S1-C subfamily serine protease
MKIRKITDKIAAHRTTMPFDGGLSPVTDKSKQSPWYGGGPGDKERTTFDSNMGGDHKFIGVEPDGVSHAVGGFFRNETEIESGDRDINYSTEIIVLDVEHKEHVYPDSDYEKVMKDWSKKRYIMMTRRGRKPDRQASSGEKQDIIPVIADVMSACFKMECESSKYGKMEIGSCFAIDETLFVTCAHVISRRQEDPKSVSCYLVESGRRHRVIPIEVDYDRDLALMSCETVKHTYLGMKGISAMKTGADILCVGSPYGYDNNVSRGMISSIGRSVGTDSVGSYFFVDLAVYPGSSGGPIIDVLDGVVIGVAAMIVQPTGNYGLNAAIPSEYVNQLMTEMKHETV